MSALAFDSLRTARQLVAAGFTQQQAEVAVEAAVQATTELITKLDLEHGLRDLEQRITIKFYGGVVAVLAGVPTVLFGLMRTFPGVST